MRIAFVSCGSFVHVRPYVEFFRLRGHDVRLLAYDRPIQQLAVPIHDVSFGARAESSLPAKWRYVAAGLLGARAVFRAWQPDIVHGHYATSAGLVCLLSGFRPYVLTAHGSDVLVRARSAGWRSLLRVVFRHASLVNPVSDEIAACVSSLGVPASRQLVATPGVDCRTIEFRLSKQVHDPVRVLCTRALAPVYDPETILDACRILKRRGVRFVMTFAAGGALESELKERCAREDLEGEVRFLGGFSQRDLPRLLHCSDLYLSASRSDGASISLLEAMAAGLFPIVSRIPSNRSWVEENRTALEFQCGDAAELAQRICDAVADAALRESAVAANRATVESRANYTEQMSLIEGAYREVLGTNGG